MNVLKTTELYTYAWLRWGEDVGKREARALATG